jgi:hypothetical protein
MQLRRGAHGRLACRREKRVRSVQRTIRIAAAGYRCVGTAAARRGRWTAAGPNRHAMLTLDVSERTTEEQFYIDL